MKQTYSPQISIALLPDQRTGLGAILRMKGFSTDYKKETLTVMWERVLFDKEGNDFQKQDIPQVANNSTAVMLATQEMLSMEEIRSRYITPAVQDEEGNEVEPEIDNSPAWMGEFQFWRYVMDMQPQALTTTLNDAGVKFAKKNGWV